MTFPDQTQIEALYAQDEAVAWQIAKDYGLPKITQGVRYVAVLAVRMGRAGIAENEIADFVSRFLGRYPYRLEQPFGGSFVNLAAAMAWWESSNERA